MKTDGGRSERSIRYMRAVERCVRISAIRGCRPKIRIKGFAATITTSEAATSYRIGSFQTKGGGAADLLYFDALPEGFGCECCGPTCEPPPINPHIGDPE